MMEKPPEDVEPVDIDDPSLLPAICLIAEVASYFRVPEYSVKTWLRSGTIFPNAFKVHGNKWRIPRADVFAYKK
jgi:excisionase family DNA binding protein